MKVTDQGFFNEENSPLTGQSVIYFSSLPVMWGSNIGMGNWETKLHAKGLIAEEYMRANESRLTYIGEKQEGEISKVEE